MVTGGPTAGAAGPGATPCVVTPATTPPPTGADVSGGGATRRSASETRRSNKPIMEKRRRARINNCLNELKTLILDAMKKDPARHSKLEKADILEMTVKHLETLQRQQVAMAAAADPTVVNKFRAGFSECAGEVGRFPGLEAAVRRRLLAHLANCLNHATGAGAGSGSGASSTTPAAPAAAPQAAQPSPAAPQAVQVHIVPAGDAASSSGVVFTAGGVAAAAGLHLLPTRLPNGDIALVLPSSAHVVRQQPPPPAAPATPELVPIPTRTASTASASSSASTSSSSSAASSTSASPVAFERMGVGSPPVMCRDVATSPYHLHAQPPPSYSPPLQKPLSLVVRKTAPEEDKPWRPW